MASMAFRRMIKRRNPHQNAALEFDVKGTPGLEGPHNFQRPATGSPSSEPDDAILLVRNFVKHDHPWDNCSNWYRGIVL